MRSRPEMVRVGGGGWWWGGGIGWDGGGKGDVGGDTARDTPGWCVQSGRSMCAHVDARRRHRK